MEIVKNLLREFKTKEEYDEVKCQLHKSAISVITESDKDELKYKYKNYFIGTYNVTSTTRETRIFGNNFTISQVSKMYIDDVEVTPIRYYTFNTIGEHTVKCTFDCDKLTSCSVMFHNCSGLTSLDVSNFDTSKVTSMNSMFSSCYRLTSLDLSGLDTSNVTNMSYMFDGCSGLTSIDLSDLDTSNVTTMKYMFYNCSGLTSLDVSSFNTSAVTNMSEMFSSCYRLTSLNISGLDTSNVTSMYGMFYNCSGLTSLDLSSFNTSAVTNMSNMFQSCTRLTSLNISGLDTSNVTNMSYMFDRCSGLTSLDLSDLDTSNVTNMWSMFDNCRSLTSLDLSSFDTSKVTSMGEMFNGCRSLTSLDLTPLDTSNVTNMSSMFDSCSGLTSLDLTPLNTSAVTNMSNMFDNCRGLTSLDLSSFDTSNVTNMSYMFSQCSGLTSLTIMGDISKVTSYSYMFFGLTTNGTLTYNCDYEDSWNNILVTNQSTSYFPSTWTKKCIQPFEFVDLGLPSGTQWATFNVGATKPEEYGLYFAWGETEGYVAYNGEGSDSGTTYITDADGSETDKIFAWSDYKFSIDGSSSNFSGYNSTDSKTTLEQDDDAAYESDNSCRMPTYDEYQELISNTTSAWTSVNGVSGIQFTSTKEGYTDKSIFIPAAGGVSNGSLYLVGSSGCIWSSSLYSGSPSNAHFMYFNSSDVYMNRMRCNGYSVRPVKK